MSNLFLDSVKVRRSIYALGKDIAKSDTEVQSTIEQAIAQAPAAFGAQPTRVVILFNQHHDKLWEIVESQLKKIVPADDFTATAQKIASFKAGHGTVLFFEDNAVIKDMQEKFSLYADKFPGWGLQAQGIAVYSVWCALADQKIGASIQHYNPLIDNDVRAQWGVPESWILLGQMPFGTVVTPAAAKPEPNVAELVKVYK